MDGKEIIHFLTDYDFPDTLISIAQKIIRRERITISEAKMLLEEGELPFLGLLANYVREYMHGSKTYYSQTYQIQPSNICVYNCRYCAFRCNDGDNEAREASVEEIAREVQQLDEDTISELHIAGSVHPERDVRFYTRLLTSLRNHLPEVPIKAFSAGALLYMFELSGLSVKEGLKKLVHAGLDFIPGSGAVIFDEIVRRQLCPGQPGAEAWLDLHETAHQVGIQSNASMLYGHIENYDNRLDHLDRIRTLQDKTKGFHSFIPLKFRDYNGAWSHLEESSIIEDLEVFAISRIFLDNVSHINACWPVIGKENAKITLNFGVDQLEGTIHDASPVYAGAASEDRYAGTTTGEIIQLIKAARRIPVERPIPATIQS